MKDNDWKMAPFQLDPDDDLEPRSAGARGLAAHAKALEGVGKAVSTVLDQEGMARSGSSLDGEEVDDG